MSEYSVCGFCIWLLQLTWHGLLFKAADKVDTGPLGWDRRKPRGQVRMPRERSQDHAPGQHTKVTGDWGQWRGWGQKNRGQNGTLETWEEGDSGMSPSYGATGACPALFVELLSFKSDNILLILILEWMSSLPIPSCNPLSEGLIRRCL